MSILTETWRTLKYLRTPEGQPLLPVFPVIRPEEIPAGSALIFYGLPGNAATERICVFKYGCPFHPPFHAALMMRDGLFHNVGQFRTDELLSREYRSERRIDVIIYKTMTEADRVAIMQAAELDTSEPRTGLQVTDYGVRTFIHQGFRFIKAGKQAICSENVVKILAQRGIRSSWRTPRKRHRLSWCPLPYLIHVSAKSGPIGSGRTTRPRPIKNPCFLCEAIGS